MLAVMTLHWWQQHDPRTGPEPRSPGPADRAAFVVGDVVRLVARPQRSRKVLEVQWHRHRHCYAYVVETESGSSVPYWFRAQLVAP